MSGVALVAAAIATAGPATGPRTSITIWSSSNPTPNPALALYGGQAYGGGYTAPTGALVVEDREVDVPGDGEIRIAGVASTLDAASVQLRSLTEPTAVVSEQRFIPGATTPTEILSHHVGDTVVVVTPKGEISGVLRSVDAETLVLEVGTGDQRHLQLMRRDAFVQDVRLPAGGALDKPSLALRLATKKPGKHTIELAYRADAMTWSADYLAVLDDNGTVDFSAWATIHNDTGAAYDDAEVTLVGLGPTPPPVTVPNAYGGMQLVQQARSANPQSRYALPARVRLGAGEAVQVELVPPRANVKASSTVFVDLMPNGLDEEQPGQPQFDCSTLFNGSTPPTPKLDTTLEVEVPTQVPLPDGKVRLFRRHAGASSAGVGRLEVVSEDQLRSAAGAARIPIASADSDLTVTRNQGQCNYDEARHRLDEHVDIELESIAARPLDLVVRETLWRWTAWKIDASDETVKGVKAGPRFHEWRVHLAAKEKKTIGYTVAYLQ
jgi:hypothetical protein